MAVNIEREFKTLITAQQAEALLAKFAFHRPYTQTNTYYDTKDKRIGKQKCALRIRQFADHAEQTIKVLAQMTPRRVVEYTDDLTPAEAEKLVAAGRIKEDGTLACQLRIMGVSVNTVAPFAQATTTRREYPCAGGLLALDHTEFPDGYSDWELELEYLDIAAAEDFFGALLAEFGIVQGDVQSKILRAVRHTTNG